MKFFETSFLPVFINITHILFIQSSYKEYKKIMNSELPSQHKTSLKSAQICTYVSYNDSLPRNLHTMT